MSACSSARSRPRPTSPHWDLKRPHYSSPIKASAHRCAGEGSGYMLDPMDRDPCARHSRDMPEARDELKRPLHGLQAAGQAVADASDDAPADQIDPVLGEVESL